MLDVRALCSKTNFEYGRVLLQVYYFGIKTLHLVIIWEKEQATVFSIQTMSQLDAPTEQNKSKGSINFPAGIS